MEVIHKELRERATKILRETCKITNGRYPTNNKNKNTPYNNRVRS